MALAGDIMRYIGNEMLPVAGKTATSALSNIAPKVVSNAGTNAIAKAGSNLATKAGTSLLDQATALGLSKNTTNKWILNTGILDTDEGVGKIKDFMNPILGGDKTPSYQRFLEQIGEGEYQMGHRPNLYIGDNETKFPLSNMEADPGYFPKIYGDNREETLRNLLRLGGTSTDHQRSASIIANYQGQPDKMVKIYRQAPKDMNYGDWVGLTKEYADYHMGNHPDNQLWEREVPAGEVMFAGDDINEWGYYPKEVQLDDELGTAIDNALANNNESNTRNVPIQQVSSSENIPVNVGERQVSPRVSVAENQASLFDQLEAPEDIKIRALNYLDKPINWAENNPAFNKLTPAQKQGFADLAVKKLGNSPTSYDVNQLFDPYYKNAIKENGMALFNSEENQGFLNKLGIKNYTSMRGTLANEGEHTYTISNTTGLPYNEKITLNASVMENMLKLQSTELHEAAHAAWLRLSPEQKISIGQDLCNKFGVDAKVGKRIANSNDLNELIAYSCEANFTSGNMVGDDGKLLDRVLGNSTAQRHLDNVAKMAGDVSPSFKERVMNVIRAFVDYIKAKIKGIKDVGTFDEFYEGLSSGDFAEDMATPIEKWSAPTKTASEQAKDELFSKLGALHKAREIPSEAFLSIDDMIRPENSIDDIMNYINQVYPDVADKLANAGEQRASENLLKDTIMKIMEDKGIDTTQPGFGKEILRELKREVFNLPAEDAQALVDAFPKLYRTDFGVDGNDMITNLKDDGGAVLSGFAKFDNVDTGKGTRRLGISRKSFDSFFKRPENSFLANPRMEVGGSPRTSELYQQNQLRNAEDVLKELREKVLDYYTSDPNNDELINSIPNIYGADEYLAGILEEIAKSKSPINTINEFKMAMGPRDISAISDMDFGNTRQLIEDAKLTLANGETVNVPANSLFGDFGDIREELYEMSKGEITPSGGYRYTGPKLSKEAVKADPTGTIYNKLVEEYGTDKTREIMAYYGGDLKKLKDKSFLGRLFTGEEVEGPLVMYHGVGTEKLKEMLGLAEKTSSEYAIPNPSVQVVNPNVSAGSSYGDVVLLGNKSIPAGRDPYMDRPDYGSKYELYSRDIYSPRKPYIEEKNGVPYIAGTRTVATPENLSKFMKRGGNIANESNMFSSGAMAATQAKRFKSPLEAIKNMQLLTDKEELEKIIDEWDSKVYGGVQNLLNKYLDKHNGEDINQFIYGDYIGEELQEAMKGKPPMEGDPYGIGSDEGRKLVEDLRRTASNLPTGYFEGKAKRAVPLREFSGALLPEGYNDEKVLQALKDNGINIEGYYDPNNYEESIRGLLNSLIKNKDRFNTKYLYSILAGLFGIGGLASLSGKKDDKTY